MRGGSRIQRSAGHATEAATQSTIDNRRSTIDNPIDRSSIAKS
jgi:hypothetical protein